MAKRYSPSTSGFYDTDFHGDIPSDAIALSEDEYREMFLALSSGRVATVVSGEIVMVDRPPPTLSDADVDGAARAVIDQAYGGEGQSAAVVRLISTLTARKALAIATASQEADLATLLDAADWEAAVWARATEIKASGDYAAAMAAGAFPVPPPGLAAIVARC